MGKPQPAAAPARRSARPGMHWLAKHATTSVVSLLITLIGTGILSMCTMYVKVAKLTDAIAHVTENQNKLQSDSISERQYQRDQALVYESMRTMATKQEVVSLTGRLDEQLQALRKIEDAIMRIETRRPR